MVQKELYLTAHHSISMVGFQFHKSAPACATSWDQAKGCFTGGESEPITWWTYTALYQGPRRPTLPLPEANGKRRSGYFCDACPWIVNAFELADCALLSLSWLIRPKGRSKREQNWQRKVALWAPLISPGWVGKEIYVSDVITLTQCQKVAFKGNIWYGIDVYWYYLYMNWYVIVLFSKKALNCSKVTVKTYIVTLLKMLG